MSNVIRHISTPSLIKYTNRFLKLKLSFRKTIYF
nr:MAG TPA: hypothetical protein [Caudoviricetes sp.]